MRVKKTVDFTGKLVTVEGIDRAGKSSIIHSVPSLLQDCTVPVTVCSELQSPIAPLIHEMLRRGCSAFLKTFLFATDRAWIYEVESLPALERGDLILWDRYVDTAIVYRSVELSRSASLIDMEFVSEINSPFPLPDLTILIDISADTSADRARLAGSKETYSQEFLELARAEYLKLAAQNRYCIINGERSFDDVTSDVAQAIKTQFKELFP